MLPRGTRGHSTAPRSRHQALPNEKWLDNGFHRLGFFAHGDGQRTQPHWSTLETIEERFKDGSVESIQPTSINVKQIESRLSAREGVRPAVDIGVVANAPEETICDSRGPATAPRNLCQRQGREVERQKAR